MEEQQRKVHEYHMALFNTKNNIQDKNSKAWKKLCEYVDLVAEEGRDEFAPREYLGDELFAQIHTLPNSISKLTQVKKVWLYGSQLRRVPPQIGEMTSLEYFDPYTSYRLHWFPYEITNCTKLVDSRVSTRALYGNYKHRRPFPGLKKNPVRYDSDTLSCSVCKKELTYNETNQLWISLKVGTDVLPLLVNACSKVCEGRLPQPPENYIQNAHKGGKDLKQPPDEDELWEEWERNEGYYKQQEKITEEPNDKVEESKPLNLSDIKPLKLIRKLWEK